MNDMSRVIVPKSDQINADDLISGPITIRIAEVHISPGTEQPVSIRFDNDDGKPWRPCKSMSRVLVAAWGPDAKAYVGRSVTLYRDPKVKWGGMEVGGIRISHMSDIEREMVMALTATKGKRSPYTVKPLAAQVDRVAEGVRELLIRISDGEDISTDAAATKQRTWLAKNRPELANQIDDAIAAQDSDDPFGTPSTTGPEVAGEGSPTDAEVEAASHGETTTLESAKAEIDACENVPDVNSRVSALRPLLSEEDGDELLVHAGVRITELQGNG